MEAIPTNDFIRRVDVDLVAEMFDLKIPDGKAELVLDIGIDTDESEPNYTIIVLEGKILFVNTHYSAPADYYVLGKEGWVLANELTYEELLKHTI